MSLAYFAKVRKSVKKLKLDDLIHNLKIAYSKAHKAADRDFLLKHLSFLQEKGLDNPATRKDLDFVLKDIEKTLGQKLESLAEAPFLQASMEAYTDGKRKACKPFKIDYSLDDADLGALNTLDEFNGWYIKDKMSKETSEIINRELGDLLERGGTKAEFAKTLETALEDHVAASKTYWEILADHTLTKIQNMGHVSGYETAGVQYVKIVAVIDSKTTPICRAMNGKVFKVKEFRKQYDKIMAAAEKHDIKAYKAAQPMLGNDANKLAAANNNAFTEDDIKRLGIKLPPYHFRCRTTHVAYFSNPDGIVPKLDNESNDKDSKQLLQTISDKNTAEVNIQNTMQSYFDKYGKETPRGYSMITCEQKVSWRAATDSHGRYWVSEEVGGLFNSALLKIKKGKKLSFEEENACKSIWHEICHNKQKKYATRERTQRETRIMETINEYVARRTYPIFIERLGGKAYFQNQMPTSKKTKGYEIYENHINAFMKNFDLENAENLKDIENILFNKPQLDIEENFTNWAAKKIAKKGGKLSDIKDMVYRQICGIIEMYF